MSQYPNDTDWSSRAERLVYMVQNNMPHHVGSRRCRSGARAQQANAIAALPASQPTRVRLVRGGDLNDYLLSVLLGVIEGLTEFLPVSSTAHLRITESFLGIDLGNGYWKMFSIVIQLGAILCLPLYFWNRNLSSSASDFPHGQARRPH